MSSEEFKDEIIKLQAIQIKNLLKKLELSLPYEEFLKTANQDENNARYKELYEIIVSSPSYKVGKKISAFLDVFHIKKFFLRFYYLFIAIKRA